MRDDQALAAAPIGFWQSVIDSLTAHIAVLDGDGRILAVNAAWRRFAANNGQADSGACIGVNYLEVCDRAFAGEDGAEGASAADGIRSVFAGRRREFFLSYPCHSPNKKRWFMLRATRFEGPGPARVVIAHENITAPKAAQLRASEAARKLESANARLRRQTADLERAEAIESGSNRILELIARNDLPDSILHEIAVLVEQHSPDHHCAVIRSKHRCTEIAAAPTLPPDLREELETAGFAPLAGLEGSSLEHLVQAVGVSGAPDIGCFRFVPIRSQSGNIEGGCLAVVRSRGDAPPPVSLLLIRAASLAGVALDHAALYEKLSFQAGHDALTNLPNRLLFQQRLQEAVTRARRGNGTFALCMIDLDRFRQINDLYGHRTGDILLRQAAQRILECVHSGDTVARLGGDEFAIILDNLRNPGAAEQTAARIAAALNRPFPVAETELTISASFGFAIFPEDADDPAALVRNTGMAMYESKNRGRNQFERYHPALGTLAIERLTIEHNLRGAVDRGELEVWYQLQYNLNGTVLGTEALVRWHSPVLGVVSPAKFIPIAEATGLIAEIGSFVLRRACLQSIEWQRSGLPAIQMAVNVSIVQLARPGFARFVADVLAETGLRPELLELEITETAMMSNVEAAVREIESLRNVGVRLSIDDFGTGYSSLSYLQNLPVHAIKIDRSFIRELDAGSGSGRSVVHAIIALAHSLNLTVVAEGVETRPQLDTLSALQCDVAQGYLLHRPLPAEAVAEVLGRNRVETYAAI